MRVGILGIGLELPPTVRTNAWWTPDVRDRWAEARRGMAPPRRPATVTEGIERVERAMRAQTADPFQGTRERRVAADDVTAADLEEAAARAAIAAAGISTGAIDLLLGFSLTPEYLLSNPGCVTHQRLGLPKQCATVQIDAAANSFLVQLDLAETAIRAGKARYALLVQSCIASRMIGPEDPGSVLVGDGATAVVVGPVSDATGIEASIQFTDGRYPKTLVASVRDARWFDPGQVRMHVADRQQMHEVFLLTADVCKESVDAVLARAHRAPAEVDFLCVYQGTPWLREVVQDYTGLRHARTHDTFATLGYLSAAMIPANLALAERAGALRDGDCVVLTGGGTGMTYGATVLTWGRG